MPQHPYVGARLTTCRLSPSTNILVNTYPQPRLSCETLVKTPPLSSLPPGYLGSTSYLAVLTENRQDIYLDPENDVPVAQTELEDGNADLRSHVSNIEEGARILTILYPLSTIDRLLLRYDGHTCGAMAPKGFVKTCWHSLRATLAHIDAQLKKEQSLLALAEKLLQNTAKPLGPPGSASMLEYATMVNGQDVRWETIGVLLAALGLCIMPATSRDAEILKSHSSPTRQSMCKRLIQATNSCLKFCDGSGSINDLVLWILGCNLILLTQFYGDSSAFKPRHVRYHSLI